MKRRLLVAILVISMFFTISSFAAKEPDNPENYKKIGNILKELNLIQGSGSTNDLKENNLLKREEAIVILLRLLKKEELVKARDPQGTGVFSDIPKGHWSIRYVEYAYENGITSGIGKGKFGLGNHITKKEFITLLLRQLGYKTEWSKNDALEVGKKCGILDETSGLKDKIVRGQAFTYMLNVLFVKPNNEEQTLYQKLGIKSDSPYFAELNKDSNSVSADKNPVIVDLTAYPRMTGARTYMYDEFVIEFNKPVRAAKGNFKFRVEGREIPDQMWNVSPGGREVRFRFKEQNLHGKELICTVTDIVDSYGKPMLGTGQISATFKDAPGLYFKEAKILNDKTVEFYMSERYQKPQYGQPYGYKVSLNGNELSEANKDYKMGWGVGNVFKVVFPEPKTEGKLTLRAWGWLELHSKKLMEEMEAEVDLANRDLQTFPEPEVGEPKDTEIVYSFDDDAKDIIESEFNQTTAAAPTTDASHTSDIPNPTDWSPAMSTEYQTGTTIESTTVDSTMSPDFTTSPDSTTATNQPSCNPAMVYTHYTVGKEAVFFTTKALRSVDGIVMEMADGTKYLPQASFTPGITGFTVRLPEDAFDKNARDIFVGAKLHVEVMVEAECGAVTDPFIYLLDSKIN